MNKDEKNRNLDNFIKKEINNISSQSSDWSDSDESRWTIIQPKIDAIYRKKKRRKALILFFGLILITSSTGLLYSSNIFNNYSKELNIKNQINDSFDTSPNDKITSTHFEKDISKAEPIENNITSTQAKEITESNTTSNKPKEIIESNIASNQTRKSPKKSPLINTQLYKPSSNLNFAVENKNDEQLLIEKLTFNESKISALIIEESSKKNNLAKEIYRGPFNSLTIPPISFETKINNPIKYIDNKITSYKLKSNPFSKWEIGIGHTQFIDNPFLTNQQVQQNNTTITLADKRYESYNFIINRNFTRNFSFTSGYHFFQQFILLNYSFKDISYDGKGNTLSNSFGLVEGRSYISDNVDKDELFIKFLPGKDVTIGTILNAEGYADAYARAHQVPLQINYHKNIRNWQLVGFTGISLNILQLEIPRFEVDIYANEELVSNDINFSPLEETVFIPNIIFGAGIRYRFYNRYNANIFYNHNPLNTSFARLQFGLTYSI